MKKEFVGAGKGMRPKMGYDPKKWYDNFDAIDWHKDKKSKKNKESN